MAVSCADHRRSRASRLPLLLLASFGACALALAASPKSDDLRIEVDAASTEIDFRNNTAVLRQVVIREGDVRVEANEATATGGVDNFDNNQWVLTGEVRIVMSNGKLAADRAVVSFVDNRIVRAVITGSPASFEQKLEDSGDLAQGRGKTIEYDVVGETVRLDGDAFLTDGHNNITGSTLVYNIRDQRVVTEGEGRVILTINPAAVEQQRKLEKEKAAGEKDGAQPGQGSGPPPDDTPPPEPPRT